MDLQAICRVCTMENSEMLSIFESYDFSAHNCEISKAITDCASVEIRKSDGFSEQICPRCLDHLSQAYSFKKLCEDSDYKFRNDLIASEKMFIKSEKCYEETVAENEFENDQDRLHEEKPDVTSQTMEYEEASDCLSSSYKCELCSESFTTNEDFVIHKRTHEEQLSENSNDKFINNLIANAIQIKSEFSVEDSIINFGENSNAGETSQTTSVNQDECLEGEELLENALNLSARKRRSKNRSWTKRYEFQLERDALAHIETENTWRKCALNKTLDGEKVEYRCKYGKYRKSECPARIYLLYHATDETVSLYATECEHDHSEESQRGLDRNIKTLVENLVHNGIVKPNSILDAIRNEMLTVPPKTKLVAFLRQLKHKKSGPPAISGSDLKKWCEEKSNLPESKDEAFVLGYFILCESLNENEDIKIVVSTVRLLERLGKTEMLQIDATHKLIWQGYPVMIIGSSDKDKVFHPLVIAVCKGENEDDFYFIFNALRKHDANWKPKYLLADGSAALTNGFIKAFGAPEVRLTCFSQILHCVEKKLKGLSDANEIKIDINSLQNCANKLMFNKASKLFVEKWRKRKELKEFLNYFEEEWLKILPNWYEGAASGFPSTNDGIEATNEIIKKEHTLRERLPVSQFLNKLQELLLKWSNARNPDSAHYKRFTSQPTVNSKDWTDAYHWFLLDRNVLNVGGRYYTCSTGSNNESITTELLERYRELNGNWETFEEFYEFYFGIWDVKVNLDLQECSCTCPMFNRNFKCKHILGLQIRLGLTKVPEEAKRIVLNKKRKRGRPANSNKVLILE